MILIKIIGLEVHHPIAQTNNSKYLSGRTEEYKHFLQDILGKHKRFERNDTESPLDIMYKSCQKTLSSANISSSDIDCLIVCSVTPQYLSPTTATYLASLLSLSQHSFQFDMNMCCLNMSMAYYNAYCMLQQNNRLHNILVVSYDDSRVLLKDCPDVAGLMGDLACSFVLSKTDEPGTSLIDMDYSCNFTNRDNMLVPTEPLSDKLITNSPIDVYFNPYADPHVEESIEVMKEMLQRNNLPPTDINHYCLSQFAISNIAKVTKALNIPTEKVTYVGDEYGYTSGNSPFLALYEAVREGKVQRGDKIFLWTVGAGSQNIFILFEY